jgi:hypothetical protein
MDQIEVKKEEQEPLWSPCSSPHKEEKGVSSFYRK